MLEHRVSWAQDHAAGPERAPRPQHGTAPSVQPDPRWRCFAAAIVAIIHAVCHPCGLSSMLAPYKTLFVAEISEQR